MPFTHDQVARVIQIARDAHAGGSFHERAQLLADSLRPLVPYTHFATVPVIAVGAGAAPPAGCDVFITDELAGAWLETPSYYPYYFQDDPRRGLFRGDFGRIQVPSGSTVVLTACLQEKFGKDAFTGEYCGYTDTRYHMDLVFDRPDGQQMSIDFLRAAPLGDFTETEARVLRMLTPELMRMSQAAALEAGLAARAARGGAAVTVLVDETGEPEQNDPGYIRVTREVGAGGRTPLRAHVRECLAELTARGASRGDLVERQLATATGWSRLRCGLLTDTRGPIRAVVSLQALERGSQELFTAEVRRARLSPREVEVANAALGGRSDSEIARALGLSVYTVKAHLREVYRKVGVRGRTALTAKLMG